MSIYTKEATTNNNQLTQTEVHLYGSSRLGIYNRKTNVQTVVINTTGTINFERANKVFELSNHLGNVLVTISDKKLAVDSDNDGAINYYTADVVTASDYYLFGMSMPGRTFSSSTGYRYGFNGKENSVEISKGAISFEARAYDSRLGKFFTTDPRQVEYAWQSPYAYYRNSPINILDVNGMGGTTTHLDPSGKVIAVYNDGDKSIYKHQTAKTKVEVDGWRAKFKNYSGNGVKVGDPILINKLLFITLAYQLLQYEGSNGLISSQFQLLMPFASPYNPQTFVLLIFVSLGQI